ARLPDEPEGLAPGNAEADPVDGPQHPRRPPDRRSPGERVILGQADGLEDGFSVRHGPPRRNASTPPISAGFPADSAVFPAEIRGARGAGPPRGGGPPPGGG